MGYVVHHRRIRVCSPTPGTARLLRLLTAACALVALAITAPTAGAIVGGTDQTSDAFAAPLAFLTITDSSGVGWCSGTLISPTVVMTAAHCVYETGRRGNLLGVSTPSEIVVRVGSRNVSNAALGTKAAVVAVLPQPYYRWDGSRHNHDVALLALDRAMPQAPAALAEQHPDAGKPLVIAGYGSTSTFDNSRPGALKEALIDAADPKSCTLVSESFDPSWLFCGAASGDPALPGGTSCYGDSGGPAFAYENTAVNLVVEGIISYGSQPSCESSRSYLVLVSSERGFIDRALATAPQNWTTLRDLPPSAKVRAVHRRLGRRGVLSLRIDDDKSRRSRVRIVFYTHAGKRLGRAFRSVPTNQWVEFDLGRSSRRFSGSICVQGSDGTEKKSNVACAADTVE
jgi:hypothetical protein